MKAGTAHKLVINMLSTCAMVHLGNVYENMMVNLKPTNAKLRERMVGIVAEIRKVNLDEARKLLDLADWNIRACVQK
jgi:N-acetylmuramic acid 6-phosphate etherase